MSSNRPTEQNVSCLQEDGENIYAFVCEGCGSEGELAIPEGDMHPFGCPDGCGATYIQWTPPGKPPTLRCVVCPVFEENQR